MERTRMEIAERIPLGTRAPQAARRTVDRLGDMTSAGVRDMARLVVSELVTNTVRHSGLRAGDPIEVRISLHPNTLRIEVAQAGSSFEPRVQTPSTDVIFGRGLMILDQVADRWGTLPNGGVTVWAELDLSRARRDAA